MKKVAHIFMPHLFTKEAVDFLKTECGSFGFEIFILQNTKSSNTTIDIEGVCYLRYSSLREEILLLKKIFDDHDVVYTHSLFIGPLQKILLLLRCPKCTHKLVWIEWGFDLYPSYAPRVIDKIKAAFKRISQLLFDKRIANFVAIHPIDIDVYHSRVGGDANIYFAPYSFSNTVDPFLLNFKKNSIEKKIKNNEPIVIQVNHRADRVLRHKEILDRLGIYKNQNIQIILPLSYGNVDGCADEIESYAVAKFGKEKIKALRSLVSLDEYQRLLSTVDIFIIYATRQIALGNIYSMLYMQKKIFLPSISNLTHFFRSKGVKIFNIEDLGLLSFEELCKDEDLSRGREYMIEYDSKDPVQMWKDLFNKI